MLQLGAGIKMTHVPYRGANLIVNDVLGGHLATGSIALSAAAGQLKAGAVRGLAISTEQRLPDFPDIPTFKEQGYPDLVASTWFALSGPANLPREIVDRLNAEVASRRLHAPEVQERFAREAIDSKSLNAWRISRRLLQAGAGALDPARPRRRRKEQGSVSPVGSVIGEIRQVKIREDRNQESGSRNQLAPDAALPCLITDL